MTGHRRLLTVANVILAFATCVAVANAFDAVTINNFFDQEMASGNTLTAWTSSLWTQTAQADFQAGITGSGTDVNTSPDNVMLASPGGGDYAMSGNFSSQVFDAGSAGVKMDALCWDSSIPAGTGIVFYIRTSDASFAADDPSLAWTYVGTASPAVPGLPGGRYVQWLSSLLTTDETLTPVLHEVRLWYY